VADGGEGAVVDAFDVDAEEAIEIGFSRGLDGADVRDARIIYENIDAALAGELVEDFFCGSLIGNVAGAGFGVRARGGKFVCGFVGGRFVQIENADGRALLRETPGDGAANPAGGAGESGRLAVEAERSRRLRAQRETPRFQGMKSFCASNSALV
jgi:hypothetical protein